MAAERPVASVLSQTEQVPPGTRARLLALSDVAARPLTTIGIGSAGFTDAPPGYLRSALGPQVHRAMITLAGDGFFDTGRERFELPAGTLLVWPTGVAAAYGTLGDQTWRRVWVALANIPRWAAIARSGVRCEPTELGEKLRVAMEGLIAELGVAKPEPPQGSADAPDAGVRLAAQAPARASDVRELTASQAAASQAAGGRAIDRYGWAYPARPDGSARALPSNMYARILRSHVHALLRVPDIERVESDGARLDRLWAHVQDHLAQDWTVDTLAKRMAVAPATLHRMTQRRYGTTPGGLLLRMRMEEAQRLLALTDEPVQKLAERFGYASPFAFSTAFKRATGLAPRAFREHSRPDGERRR